MDELLQKVSLFRGASAQLLAGQKIDPALYPEGFVPSLYRLLTRMHAGFFISAEPQSYIKQDEYAHLDPKYMGRTDIHPLMESQLNEAEYLKAIAVQKGEPVSGVEVLGLEWQNRKYLAFSSANLDEDKIPVLLPGDIASLHKACVLLEERLGKPKVILQKPFIIQDPDFWQELIGEEAQDPQKVKMLKRLGILISNDQVETTEFLAQTNFGQKTKPQDINFDLACFSGLTNPYFTFATSDKIKFGHDEAALKESGLAGEIRQASSVIGPYEIPDEEQYSFEGNAYIKMVELIKRLEYLGIDNVKHFYRMHGVDDISQVVMMTNDGGLGTCLENAQGERYIGLFSDPEFFPDTYKKMNPMQMDPGVELAHLKTTTGLRHAMAQLFTKVKDVCAKDNRFDERDLRAYDTALQMFIPLQTVINELATGKSAEEIVQQHAVCVGAAQRLKMTETPKFLGNKPVEVAQTEHYLLVPDETETRDQMPDWVLEGPNAASFRMLQRFAGITTPRPEQEPQNIRKLRMGILATPEALYARGPTSSFRRIHAMLVRESISTQQGHDYWKRYKLDRHAVLEQAGNGGVSNSEHCRNIRTLLDHARVLYIGRDDPLPHSTNMRERTIASLQLGLTFLSAVVRNQVLNPIPIVVDKGGTAAKWLRLIEHKQQLGLIGQKAEHLFTKVDGEDGAAKAIIDKVRTTQRSTGVQRRFHAHGQTENNDCVVATAYFSATNRNETWVTQAERLGYLFAANGFSLKVGGGNDGLMKAVADGFTRGKQELEDKGYDFPNQLILIQCEDTKAIEKEYKGEGVHRSHPEIEPRRADLQCSDFKVAGAGGSGTDEEAVDEFLSRMTGLINPAESPMVLFNQQAQTVNGPVGVYDPYPQIFGNDFLANMNAKMALTPEEIVSQAAIHRAKMQMAETHALQLHTLRDHLHNASNPALAQRIKWFRPKFGTYLGEEGGLPPKSDTKFETNALQQLQA